MTCIAAMEVELGESPIGTRSRAADTLHGSPVATRTMRQVCAAQRINHLFVLCDDDDVEACRPRSRQPPPWRNARRGGRGLLDG